MMHQYDDEEDEYEHLRNVPSRGTATYVPR